MESIVSLQTGLLIYPLHKKTIGVRQSFGRERPSIRERKREIERKRVKMEGGRDGEKRGRERVGERDGWSR